MEHEPESIALATWEEVQGEVMRSWTEAGERVLVLRTPCGAFVRLAIYVPMPTHTQPNANSLPVTGDRVAVLRTDLRDRPFMIRFLGVAHAAKGRSD